MNLPRSRIHAENDALLRVSRPSARMIRSFPCAPIGASAAVRIMRADILAMHAHVEPRVLIVDKKTGRARAQTMAVADAIRESRLYPSTLRRIRDAAGRSREQQELDAIRDRQQRAAGRPIVSALPRLRATLTRSAPGRATIPPDACLRLLSLAARAACRLGCVHEVRAHRFPASRYAPDAP